MRFRFKTYKLNRRRKRKQKGKSFAKSLGNFWNIWRKGLGGWEGKKVMQWWNLMSQKELCYQMVEHLLLVIKEYLKDNCHLILLCVELMRKELCQEVEDVDKEVAEFWFC